MFFFLLCNALLSVLASFAIISPRKWVLVALFYINCVIAVFGLLGFRPLEAMDWSLVSNRSMSWSFPGHTHLLLKFGQAS